MRGVRVPDGVAVTVGTEHAEGVDRLHGVRRIAAVAFAAILTACGSMASEQTSTGMSAGVAVTPAPCPAPDTSPRVMRRMPSAVAGNGLQRITSADGGWSLNIPDGWVANVGDLRGAEIYSFDPIGAELSGNVPPAREMRISVRLQPNLHGRDPLAYAAKEPSASAGATVLERRELTLGGAPAALTLGRSYSPKPFDLVHAWWFVRPPQASDRMLVIDAWPVDGTLRAQAERIASTLRLFALPAVPTAPAITRDQAERCFITQQVRRADHVEGKLVLWRDYELLLERALPNGPRPVGDEPDRLLWLILVRGDIAPFQKGAPPPPGRTPAPPVPPDHLLLFIDAMTGQLTSQGGGRGAQPSWWDPLRDRSR